MGWETLGKKKPLRCQSRRVGFPQCAMWISFLHLRNSWKLTMNRLSVQLLTVMMQRRSRKGEGTVKERTERRRNCGKQKTQRIWRPLLTLNPFLSPEHCTKSQMYFQDFKEFHQLFTKQRSKNLINYNNGSVKKFCSEFAWFPVPSHHLETGRKISNKRWFNPFYNFLSRVLQTPEE